MTLDPYGKVRPRRPTLKGAMVLDVTRGAQRARVWPGKRGKPKTKAETDRQERFRMIQWAVKYLPAVQQAQYREACAGTALLPRDLLTMAMYGRFCAIKRPDGKIIYPMTARQDISESIDIINQVPGSLLFRGPEYWEPLLIGAPGQVLAVNPAGDGVMWVDFANDLTLHSAASFHWDGAAIIIEGQSNIASITRPATGIYEVTMAIAASDANYLVLCGGKWPVAGDTLGITVNQWRNSTPTPSVFQVQAFYNNSSMFDPENVFVAVIDLNA